MQAVLLSKLENRTNCLVAKHHSLSCGQIIDYESPNQHGAIPYLWQTGTTYKMFDAYTGDLVLTLANASTGRITMDAQGDMCVYVLRRCSPLACNVELKLCTLHARTNWWHCVHMGSASRNYTRLESRNTMEQTNLPSAPIYGGSLGICTLGENTIVASCITEPDTVCAIGYSMTGIGHQLWQTNITSNVANENQYFILPIANGVFTFFRQETMQFSAYSITTGQLVWGPTTPYTNAWGMFTSSTVGIGASNPTAAYGNLYATAYDGEVHAYDMSTGTNLWNFYDGNTGFEESIRT